MTDTSSALILYNRKHELSDLDKLTSIAGVHIIMSLDEAVISPPNLEGEFSLVIVDLAYCTLLEQNPLVDLLEKLPFRNSSLIILHEENNKDEISVQLLEKASVLLQHPVNIEQLEKVLQECLRSYQQKTSFQKDLNSIMSAFKSMEKGCFPFQSLSDAKSLSLLLSVICPNSNDAAVGLLELMVNGIEHGNLEISFHEKGKLLKEGLWHSEIDRRLTLPKFKDRVASIEFCRNNEKIEFLITDEGAGFDVEKYLANKQKEDDVSDFQHFHGRGIKVAKKVCFDELEYLGQGNQVKATIHL
ncbi:MAG: ATP-binding protein [Sneathiellales bacterium]|nr:ATP-binding protein [Sneathiellales bacterium]